MAYKQKGWSPFTKKNKGGVKKEAKKQGVKKVALKVSKAGAKKAGATGVARMIPGLGTGLLFKDFGKFVFKNKVGQKAKAGMRTGGTGGGFLGKI
tara:strand:+ start:1277 stop:1561 length:285 start_codon:yes stop_codon:yes gene_type:complete